MCFAGIPEGIDLARFAFMEWCSAAFMLALWMVVEVPAGRGMGWQEEEEGPSVRITDSRIRRTAEDLGETRAARLLDTAWEPKTKRFVDIVVVVGSVCVYGAVGMGGSVA